MMLAAAAALWGTPVQGDENERLEQVEQALEQDQAKAAELERKAEALRSEIASLQQDMVAAAKAAQDLEEALTNKERTLAELEARRAEKLAALQARHGQLSHTLGALQRIALSPPEAAIAAPGAPIDTARSALLLSTAVPAIERRADALRADLAALDELREIIAQERREIAAATRALVDEQKRLTGLIDRKRGLEQVTTAEQRAARARARKLAREAKDLRDFVAKLEREALKREEREREQREARAAAEQAAKEAAEQAAKSEQPDTEAASGGPGETQEALLSTPGAPTGAPTALDQPGNIRSFPETPSAANLVLPARGKLVITYGDRRDDEPAASKGISIRTRDFAQVVAPYDGRVAYAGEFRGYGQILIIEHGGRYHTLLAGLERIDAIAGQWVLAGEPIGLMGRAEEDDPLLYLELRRTGQPINPLPWFATTDSKVQG